MTNSKDNDRFIPWSAEQPAHHGGASETIPTAATQEPLWIARAAHCHGMGLQRVRA
jgi:hypothetical protein